MDLVPELKIIIIITSLRIMQISTKITIRQELVLEILTRINKIINIQKKHCINKCFANTG